MTSSILSQDGDPLGLNSKSSLNLANRARGGGVGGGDGGSDPSTPWFAGLLSHEDLAVVDPTRGRFLLQLRALATRRRQILTDPTLSHEDRCRQADNLSLAQPGNLLNSSTTPTGGHGLTTSTTTTTNVSSVKPSIVSQKIHSSAGQGVRLEDLGLTFQFAPSSKVFGFTDVELRTGGADFEVCH